MSQRKLRSEFEEFGFPFQDYLEEPEPPEDYSEQEVQGNDFSREIAGTFEEKLKILGEAIEEVDCEIGIRLDLSRNMQERLKGSRDWIAGKLNRFEAWQWGYKSSVDFRRTSLERELLGVYRDIRSEQQRAFSDIVALKRERRSLLMEYKSLKATEKALAP